MHDRNSELNGKDCGIAEDLLLSSDLKGYIAHPEYYFESDDETHAKWLDLLFLVKGWRRYDFAEMTGRKPFKLIQPSEQGQLLTGYLLANKGKRLPMPGAGLKVDIYFPGKRITGECKTDSVGGFALMPPAYYGEGVGRFYTYENGKPKTMRIFLDRNFAPAQKCSTSKNSTSLPILINPHWRKAKFSHGRTRWLRATYCSAKPL